MNGTLGPTRHARSALHAQRDSKSWSVVVHDVHLNERGEQVRTMYAYGKRNSRIRTEVHAEPMPKEIAALGMQCFFAVRHVLCDVCASSPPNHCQLLGYYGLFDSKVGIHKDDHELNTLYLMQLGQMDVADAVNTTKGAMVPGSDVMIYTNGSLHMNFAYHYLPKDRPYGTKILHETHPYMTCRLFHGSVFVFKAIDDLHFYHSVYIDWESATETDYRFAFVFRWLGDNQLSDFPVQDAAPA